MSYYEKETGFYIELIYINITRKSIQKLLVPFRQIEKITHIKNAWPLYTIKGGLFPHTSVEGVSICVQYTS